LFGIRYPILQGGMLWLATAELASAISNAGALGVLSPCAGMEESGDPLQNLQFQIGKIRQRTPKPFGVNIPLDLPASGLLIDLILRENIRIVITAAGSPDLYTEILHSAGILVVHVISSAAQARHSESCGADAVIAEGSEAGGRVGRGEVPLMSLLPQVADAVSIPVIAAGGIADGRGLAAAFALGADGVQLGTRFVAVDECIAHPRYKRAIVDAGEGDTIVTRRGLIPTRSLRTRFIDEIISMEKEGASAESIRKHVGRGRARQAQIDGNLADGDAYAGSSAGMIRDILPAAAVMEDLIRAFKKL
jgi:enoyl-[acyl-carrier protein] reductase II